MFPVHEFMSDQLTVCPDRDFTEKSIELGKLKQ